MAEYENIIDLDKLGRFHNNLKDKGLPLNDWQAYKDYKVGYSVKYNNKMYICNTDHTSGADFDSDNWDVISGGGISIWQANTEYEVNDVVIDDNLIWQCVVAHTSTSTFDESKWEEISGGGIFAWKSNKNYKVGIMVVYKYCIYMCKVAHTSTSEFDYSKWIVMSSTVGSSADPVGTIISYMGNTPPVNYLACDGTIYNIADYQDLAEHINTQFGTYNHFGGDGTTTFAVPDLRGEFLRGTGTNSHANQGSGANVGVHQDSTEVMNIYTRESDSRLYVFCNGVNNNKNYDTTTISGGKNLGFSASSAYDSTPVRGTIRPTNTSILYCIKYTEPGVVYSTEEQRIGTWIDGKPLYRKAWDGLSVILPASGTQAEFVPTGLSSLNIDKVINISGNIKGLSDYSSWELYVGNRTWASYDSSGKIHIGQEQTGNGNKFYLETLILEYTKN